MDGRPVYSCSQLAPWVDGREILTVEGLAQDGRLSVLQQAFVDHNGPQCGFCTSGQLMSATALLAADRSPKRDDIRRAMTGNLCRCSNYNAIVEGVLAAGAPRRLGHRTESALHRHRAASHGGSGDGPGRCGRAGHGQGDLQRRYAAARDDLRSRAPKPTPARKYSQRRCDPSGGAARGEGGDHR